MELNENQIKMLKTLAKATKDSPIEIEDTFPMADQSDAIQKQNYIDYLDLYTRGFIGSHGKEWITEKGAKVLSSIPTEA